MAKRKGKPAVGKLRAKLWGLLALSAAALLAVGQSGPEPGTSPATQPATASATRPAAAAPADVDIPPGAKVTEEGWFAPRKREAGLPSRPEEPEKVFVIPIREEITTKTFDGLKRKARRCRAAGADLVILDMDTWGGEVGAALDITRLIKTELHDIYTITYVRTRAISAGAMIATACDEIILSNVGKYGDSAPISMGGTIEGVEREKIETVLRNEFKESAQRNGYPDALAQKMVSASLDVWLIRHRSTDEIRYVLAEEWKDRVARPGELLSGKEWKYVRTVVPKGRLLTLTPKETVDYGFASAIVRPAMDERPLEPLYERLNMVGEPTFLEDNWSENLAAFFMSPAVSSILLLVGIVGVFSEMRTPGFGVPGIIGILAFAVLFGSRYLTNMAQWWEIALFALGLVLLAVEVFVIPGFGVVGIAGILCCLVALVAIVVPNAPDEIPWPKTNLDWDLFNRSLFWMALGLMAGVLAILILSQYLPNSRMLPRQLVLAAAEASEEGGAPVSDASPIRRIRPGDRGVVEGMCRPVGKVRFGDDLLDAVTEGGVIERGAMVRVLRREGNRVVVERTA